MLLLMIMMIWRTRLPQSACTVDVVTLASVSTLTPVQSHSCHASPHVATSPRWIDLPRTRRRVRDSLIIRCR